MPKKQNKKKVEESEEEESVQSERSEEESEDKDSEGSDEGSDKEKDSDDEEEDSDKSEKSDDDESGSDKSSDDGSKSGSDDESKSGSDDDESDEDEDSDDSGKKKKKKGGKKDKKNDKKKGGKKGEKEDKKGKKDGKKGAQEAEKKVTIAAPIAGPTPTLSSVMQDLDDLAVQLAKTFPSFRQESQSPIPDIKTSSTFPRSPFEDVRLQSHPITSYGNAHHYHPPTREELPVRSMRKPYSEPIFNADYKNGTTTHGHREEHRPLHRDISIQYEAPVVRNPSPEAVRAVNEYRQRKEQEKRGFIDRSVGSIHDMVIEPFSTSGTINKKEVRSRQANTGSDGQDYGRGEMPEIVEREERTEKTGRGSQERTEYQDQRDYEYGMQRSRKNFAKSSQLAEDYYGHVKKVSTSPQRKTLQDLYKHKPKPMYVESGNKQTLDRYHANAQSYGNSSTNYRVNSSAGKQQEQNFRQSGYSHSHQKNPNDGDNKRLINNAMEVLLKKSQNNYK